MGIVFTASRMTSGNCLFPTVLELTDDALIRRKRSWFTVDETRMHLSKVASVHVRSGLMWTDIRIESSGGGDDIVSHGHRKADARKLQDAIQATQTRLIGQDPEDGRPGGKR